MNSILKIYLVVLAIALNACSKTMELGALDFDASLSTETIKVGEEMSFNLTGNANIITFYSGELGKDYQYRDGRPLSLSAPMVSFSSDAWYGTQRDQISILVSTEFNGDYSAENVNSSFMAGEWIDISHAFPLTENTGTRQTVSNGPFDLSSIITDAKKDIYFAYRNLTSTAGNPTQWTFSRFLITANTLLGQQTLVDQKTADWQLAVLATPGQTNTGTTPSSSVWFPRNTNKNAIVHNWIITKKIDFADKDLGPDIGTPIKSYADPQLTELKHTYHQPGTYIASFLASNVNANGEVKVVKQVKVVVEP